MGELKLEDTYVEIINGVLVIRTMEQLFNFGIFCVFPQLFRKPFKKIKREKHKSIFSESTIVTSIGGIIL